MPITILPAGSNDSVFQKNKQNMLLMKRFICLTELGWPISHIGESD